MSLGRTLRSVFVLIAVGKNDLSLELRYKASRDIRELVFYTSPSGLPRRDDDYPARKKLAVPIRLRRACPGGTTTIWLIAVAGHPLCLSQLVIAPPGQARRGRYILVSSEGSRTNTALHKPSSPRYTPSRQLVVLVPVVEK